MRKKIKEKKIEREKNYQQEKEKLILLIKNNIYSFLIGFTVFVFSLLFVSKAYLPKLLTKKTTQQTKTQEELEIKKNYQTYIVQEGDTLFEIAEKFYSDGNLMDKIAEVNKLKDVNQIEKGQKLIIPKIEEKKDTESKIEIYIVQPGDSLSSIAQKFYGNLYQWPKIAQANNLQNPEMIEVGMRLVIPR